MKATLLDISLALTLLVTGAFMGLALAKDVLNPASDEKAYACQALTDRATSKADTTHAITKCGDWGQPTTWRFGAKVRK